LNKTGESSSMNFDDRQYNFTLHVLTTLLLIEFEWGIAVFIGWFSVQ
jgi:hypothetical protein